MSLECQVQVGRSCVKLENRTKVAEADKKLLNTLTVEQKVVGSFIGLYQNQIRQNRVKSRNGLSSLNFFIFCNYESSFTETE